jgi:Domain of unknown function (DUF4383)
MKAPLIARVLGLLFLIAGVAGLLPWIAPGAALDAPVVTLDIAYRMLLWVFPVNVAHDVLHLLFGIWGVVASLRFKSSILYCRSVAWIYLLVVILGIIPITNTLFGVAPVYGWDVALHLLIVLVAAYGGYGRGSIEDVAQAPAA